MSSGLRLDEAGYDPDDVMRNHSQEMNVYGDNPGHPTVLHPDPGPQHTSQYSSLRDAAPTNFRAVAEPLELGPSLSWDPLPCVRYERGRRNEANPRDVVCFNRMVGGVLVEGVSLANLSENRNLPDLVNGDGAGLPNDVAAKISVRIEFLGCEPYTRQIMSRRSTRAGEPISLLTLAHKVAQETHQFMELTMKVQKPLIHEGIVLETKDLLLCRLYRASSGSWVPEFKVPRWTLPA